jgi:purine-binding chemotaxis protein CheW
MNNSKLPLTRPTADMLVYNDMFNRLGGDGDPSCYGFNLGKWNFLLPKGEFAELISEPNYTQVPNAPTHFLGLANLRGNVLPYYSFSRFFPDIDESATKPQEYALLLGDAINGAMVEIDNKPVAIPMSSLKLVDTNSLELPNSIRAFVQGVYSNERDFFLMLEVSNLIDFLTSVNFPNYD